MKGVGTQWAPAQETHIGPERIHRDAMSADETNDA
jgi:hypothetical protein